MADALLADSFVPDYATGVSRGGDFVATAVRALLPVYVPHFSIGFGRDRRDPKKRIVIESSIPKLIPPMKGLKFLLCEDIVETGESMKVAKKWLELQGGIVRTLAFFVREGCEFTPDYLFQSKPLPGISFPWERMSDRYQRAQVS